jgi:hypothetical protein
LSRKGGSSSIPNSDSSDFGYIPRYHPLWSQPTSKEDEVRAKRRARSLNHSLGARYKISINGPTYELTATHFTVDWLILSIQLGFFSPLLWLSLAKLAKKPQ